ncbi:MAG TPA: hypothetical protein VE526_08095 [Solirubrobacteraceae bacterium]|nr:hypothetical protein [Solirubrobacteraceae bacterium]
MRHHDERFGDGLDEVGERLRDARPALTPLELDAVQRRVLAPAARSTTEGTRTVKTRIAIIATLMFGMLFSTAGAGLAVGGFADDDQASVAQYANDDNRGGVRGEQDEGGVLGASDESADDVSAAEQTEFTVQGDQTGGQLPFTGFAAIPVLLVGLALLGGGTLLMRRSGDAGR